MGMPVLYLCWIKIISLFEENEYYYIICIYVTNDCDYRVMIKDKQVRSIMWELLPRKSGDFFLKKYVIKYFHSQFIFFYYVHFLFCLQVLCKDNSKDDNNFTVQNCSIKNLWNYEFLSVQKYLRELGIKTIDLIIVIHCK